MIALAAVFVALATALVLAAATSVAPRSRSLAPDASEPNESARRTRWRRRPTHRVTPAALARWADDLARTLRHGSTLRAALSEVTPGDAALVARCEPLRHWLERGATVTDACDEWSASLGQAHPDAPRLARRRAAPDDQLIEMLAAVLAATAALGGNSAAPLDRFAVTMRQRASDDLERQAQSAQAQMSARVLTAVPLGVLALLLLTDANVRSIVAQPGGFGVVALGLTANAAGAVWMRRIVGAGALR